MTSLSETSLLAGSSGVVSGYKIDQSIRFNSADNPSLSKTFSGAGTEETWTFSCWFKRGGAKEETRNMIFSAGSAGNTFGGLELGHGSGTSYGRSPLIFYNYTSGSYNWRLQTSMSFGDFSAWYHVVVVCDTTNAVETDRARIYVNGVRQTSFNSSISAPSFPSLNFSGNHWMGTTEHDIGTSIFTTQNFDGYLAEIHNIDGSAYGPEYFGEFKEDVGIWIPKEYEGSYGTNGFYIDGRDSSDLGDDESGRGNDFTASNLAANDKRADSPTNNHVTFNPVAPYIDGATMTFKNGSLDVTNTSSAWGSSQTTIGIPGSGKWTFAFKLTNSLGGSSYPMFGIIDSRNQTQTDGVSLPYQSGTPANSMVYVNTYQDSSQAYFFKGGNGSESTIGSAFAHGGATNGEWQWFVNSDDEELTVYHNGTVRLDAYDISFLTFPVFIAATMYDYDDLRLLNEPGTEYTPSISGYKAINTTNIGS